MTSTPIGKIPAGIAVLPFYGTAAVFFLVLCVLMLLAADELTRHYFSPHVLAIVHTAALGWGTMVIFGAAYQLLPVICERDLFSIPMAVASYCLLTVGTLLMVWSFWGFRVRVSLIWGGALVVASTLLYGINACGTAFSSRQLGIHRLFMMVSALWLLITAVIGLLLAINLSHTFIPRPHVDVLKLHAHAGLAGWFLQLITGVSAKLVPMFLLGKSKKTWLLYAALLLQNMGLVLFLADGYFNPITGKMLWYAGIVGLGTLAWLGYLVDTYCHRLRKKVETLMRHTAVSFGYLIAGFILLPMAYHAADVRWATLYGTFLFLGWITGIILGKTFKTLPFIVWNIRYQQLHGKAHVPLPKQLYNERLTIYQFYLYLGAFSSLVIGMVTNETWVIRTALFLWLALAVIYLVNVVKVLFHKPVFHHGTIT
ncbi:hypothetical protein [Parapedobacter koreensis]|uniref:Cytochrome C and Quinol oxidase polypeptide I n=1 Tax=Parapedobacter koreensis TaxID=332977 RepID=A0A1H7RJA2_9SPHI|nr:hypothetical protein [Parapedobacter koreensis]SEL59904.1 hypothetical protein SAMN05421740_107133 [Parapedobacter koreensis]